MAAKSEYTVIELDGPRLCALGAMVSSGGVEVTRWHTGVRPESVPADNAAAVGAWVGAQLKEAGLTLSRVVIAASRNDVVLKPLNLPAGADANEASIAGAVRLQMVRQLTMSLEGTAIDYTAMPVGDNGVGVLAAAMPGDRIKWWKDLAAGGGLKLKRIGLRCSGASALLAELSQRRSGPLLGVALGAASTEFVVVEDGQMMLARAADIPLPGSPAEYELFAQRVGVEAKRTWISYRSARAGLDVELVAVLGEGHLVRTVAHHSGEAMAVPSEVVGLPAIAERSCEVPESDRASMAALVGLLVEPVVGKPTLDFANPRKVPDVAAQRRQKVLVAVAVLLIGSMTGFVLANKELGKLKGRLETAQAEEAQVRKQVDQFLATHARVSHLDQWQALKIDWLPHLRRLSDQLPDPHDSTLDKFSGRLTRANSVYTQGTKSGYPNGEWKNDFVTSFEFDGKSDNRQVTADLRERLLNDGIYRVISQGPDLPDRFSIELITSFPTPDETALAKSPTKGVKPAVKSDEKAPASKEAPKEGKS